MEENYKFVSEAGVDTGAHLALCNRHLNKHHTVGILNGLEKCDGDPHHILF